MTFFLRRYFAYALIVLLAVPALAYDRMLDSTTVRDAYFVGTSNSQAADLLSAYKNTLSGSASTPEVTEMEVLTPYAQVVRNSRQHSLGYSAQQAQQDYAKDPNTLRVRIRILFATATSIEQSQPAPGCQGVERMNSVQGCFPGVKFAFTQAAQIQPRRSYGVPIYSIGDSAVLAGGDVWFVFRTSDVASTSLQVTVTAADGSPVSSTFDLASLR